MLFGLLCFPAVIQVVSAVVTPAPPLNVHVDEGLLTWTPAGETDVTYTVQHISFDSTSWKDVTSCVQTSFTSCNVAFSKAESEHGCVTLRVSAHRRGLSSKPVAACSSDGDSCSPAVTLTPRPGSLTVNLSANHTLALEHGGHVKHRVYYGRKGESMQNYKDGTSSVTIDKLEEGQWYCAKVQFMYFDRPVGLESCKECKVIPKSKQEPNHTLVIAAVVSVVFILACLISAAAYIHICHSARIKKWLQPPCRVPDHFTYESSSEPHILSLSDGEEDYCDVRVVSSTE